MKYIIINTELFSRPEVKESVITKESLPMIVKKLIQHVKDVFIVLDESSKIKTTKIGTEPKAGTYDRFRRKKKSAFSIRSRVIWQLNDVGHRCAMTGSLVSKSLLDAYGQYLFLRNDYFPEGLRAFAEHYTVLVTKQIVERRVTSVASPKDWDAIKKRVIRIIEKFREDKDQINLDFKINLLMREYGIRKEALRHIAVQPKYNVFINEESFYSRVKNDTMFFYRKDLYDVGFDEHVIRPIHRQYDLTKEQKKIIRDFTANGFIDSYVLSSASGMELLSRITDVLNGHIPYKICASCGNKDLEDSGSGKKKSLCRICGGQIIVQYNELKENPKMDLLLEMLDEINIEKNQVVIWSSRTNAIKQIGKHLDSLDIQNALYYGDIPQKDRNDIENAFENGDLKVLIANPHVAGFGLNCLGKCHYAIYYQVPWSCEVMHQSKHRLLRGELTEASFCYILKAAKTVEERIIESISNNVPFFKNEYEKEFFAC